MEMPENGKFASLLNITKYCKSVKLVSSIAQLNLPNDT